MNEKNRCELTIVGEGRERKTIENLIIDLSLEELVHLVGFSDEPDRYVSQADLFVLSSLSEGFGIAAVEAMYQGVPCLCTNVGGIPEFITDGKNGWLFNPSNLHELISKMNTILNMKKQDLHEIGLKGKEHALTHFSIENYIQTLEEIYQTSNK